MKRFTLAAIAAMLLMAGPALANAQPRGERGERMMKELNLSDEQAAKLKEMRTTHMKAMTDQQAAVQKAEIDLRSLMTADEPDKAAIKSKMKDIADLRLKQEQSRVDHLFEMRSVLTPEQRKIWKEKMGGRMMDGRGMHRPGRMEMHRDGRGGGPGMRDRDRMHQ